MKRKFNSKFILFGIELMLFVSLFDSILPSWVKYVDEVFCVTVAVLLVINVIAGKRVFTFYILMPLLLIIGLFGNFVHDIQPNFLSAIMDGFMFLKPYILLMYITTAVSKNDANIIYGALIKLSKFTIIVLFIFYILFALIKSTFKVSLFGGNYFTFYSGFTGTVAMTVIVCMTIIVSNSHNNRLLYYILCTVIIIGTGSGLGMLSVVLYATLYWFFEQKRRFRWYYLLIIVPLCILVGWNEISGYLLDVNAPRYLLFYYSFVTAWTYFPIGSGFASYASSLAATQYSSLYYRYGFSKIWGMSKGDISFLMDSYFPQIIGQTGFLGSIIYGTFVSKLFFKLIWPVRNTTIRCALVFLFAVWAASGLGFGCGSLWGCLVYTIVPILYLVGNDNEKIHIKQ